MKEILNRDFIFEVDDQRGFQKLKEFQFSNPLQGIIQEPIANAIDQQKNNIPIKITLEDNSRIDGYSKLTYFDSGEGLLRHNLEAIHFIGKSTKKENRRENIGRFGMGLVGAFHPELGIRKIIIKTKVCGIPSKVEYENNKDNDIPSWVRKDLIEPIEGFSITFIFPTSKFNEIQKALKKFCSRSIIPINFNGFDYLYTPSYKDGIATRDHILIKTETDPEIDHYLYKIDLDITDHLDDLLLYINNMLVIEGEIFGTFYGPKGGKYKSPGNYLNLFPKTVFGRDEFCFIRSFKAEPTIGKDDIVHNDAYIEIKRAIHQTRINANVKLLNTASPSDKEYSDTAVFYNSVANLYILADEIGKYFKNKSHNSLYETLIEKLIEFPLYRSYENKKILSVNEIIEMGRKYKYLFYAKSREEYRAFGDSLNTNFILAEKNYQYFLPEGKFLEVIGSILLRICKHLEEGFHLWRLKDSIYDSEKYEELVKGNILSPKPDIKIEKVKIEDDLKLQNFIKKVTRILNEDWFLETFQFEEITSISLVPVKIIEKSSEEKIFGGIMMIDRNEGHLEVAVNVFNPIVTSLSKETSNFSHLVFAPILCQDILERRERFIEENLNEEDKEKLEGTISITPNKEFLRHILDNEIIENLVQYFADPDNLISKEMDIDDEEYYDL